MVLGFLLTLLAFILSLLPASSGYAELELRIQNLQPELELRIQKLHPELELSIQNLQPELELSIQNLQPELELSIQNLQSELELSQNFQPDLQRWKKYGNLAA